MSGRGSGISLRTGASVLGTRAAASILVGSDLPEAEYEESPNFSGLIRGTSIKGAELFGRAGPGGKLRGGAGYFDPAERISSGSAGLESIPYFPSSLSRATLDVEDRDCCVK